MFFILKERVALSLQTQKDSNLSDLRVRLVSLNMGGIEKHTIMNYARMHKLICVFFWVTQAKNRCALNDNFVGLLKTDYMWKNKDYDESEQL